ASLEKQGLNPDDIEEEEEEGEEDDDDEEDQVDDDATEKAEDVLSRGADSQQDTASDHTRFDGDVSFLDDPDLDRMQKAKLYWEKRIDIVIQFQQSARCRLAERLLEEKRQARRYLRMWESATVMQTYCRMVLGRRALDGYKAERDAAIEAERQRIEWEEENRRLAEEAEISRQLEERAERDRVRAEKERREQEEKRLAEEKAEKERIAREQEAAALERRKRLESERAELERRIVGVQALIRGRLARKLYADMRGWIAAITRFQALCRGYIVREEYGSRLSSWKTVEMGVKKIQALSRGYLVRQRLKERRTHLKRNVNVIVKLQNMYRAKLAGKAYRTLTVEDMPPTPKVVQSCASILEDTDQDIEEELDLERHRQLAVRQIRENQQTTRILEQLDIKIALLVRNRISLEEVVRQTSRHFRFLDEMRKPSTIASPSFRNSYSSLALSGVVPANSLYSLKNLDKESRKRLDGYQHLFYLLQTQPTYLARLLFLLNQGGSKVMRQSQVTSIASTNGGGLNGRASTDSGYPGSPKGGSGEDISISKLIETIVLTLFGFAQNAREEYLLLKLLCSAIKIEMDSISNIQEFLRGNPIFIKLAVHYNRGAKERKYLRDLLQPLIKKVLDDPEIDLESDPLVIYRSLIREEESRTGEKSRRQYDVTREVALNDFETRTTFIKHLRQLRTLAEEFVDAILKSLDEMPYGMRYIARELRRALTTKFPDEPEQQVMKVVGHLVYYRYINPAIIAPEMFD
ncbi:iqgap- protein, partial [Linderina pennispora]